jgi:hypothetical protein
MDGIWAIQNASVQQQQVASYFSFEPLHADSWW